MANRLWLLGVVALTACDGSQPNPAQPSPVAVIQPQAAPAPSVVAPPSTPPPVAIVVPAPPVTATRPFTRWDCEYGNLSAIRCYNPSGSTVVLSAAVGPAGRCDQNFAGVQTNVVIPPGTNGYFTLPQVRCGERWQLDFWYGAQTGNCSNPDFTAERLYDGPACPPVPPPPPTNQTPLTPRKLCPPGTRCW